MAGLFRRFRRAKSQDLETESGGVDEATSEVEVAPEASSEFEAGEPEAEAAPLENPDLEVDVAVAPTEPPATSLHEPSPQPGSEGTPVAAALPAALPSPVPVATAPPAPAPIPAPASVKWVEPPLPRPDVSDPAHSVPPGTRANCFLCGTPLEAAGRCPSCEMSWVE